MKISEKYRKKSEKYRHLSEKVGKNRTNEISVQFSFRGSPKNDISAKYRPKKPKFLSMVIANLQLVGHRVTCIMVSLDIYAINIIPLGNCSQMRLFLLIT